MKIHLRDVKILCELFKCISPETPRRIDTILEYAKQMGIGGNLQESQMVHVSINGESKDEKFTPERETLIKLSQNISLLKEAGDVNITQVPVILLPTTLRCCHKYMTIITSYATLLVYCEDGCREGRSYHAKCRVCGTSIYHGYRMHRQANEISFEDESNTQFLIFNSSTAFSMKLMKIIDNTICIGGVSFEKTAELLTANHDFAVPLNPDRLESAWFVYRISQFSQFRSNLPWPRKSKSKELDVEELSKIVYRDIKNEIDDIWKSHICEEPGCRERFVIIDGNEKMYRAICAAEKKRIIGGKGNPNGYDICIRNPVRGNQHNASSKFCKNHENESSGKTAEVLDLRPITRSITQNIPKAIKSDEGCKEDKNIVKYYNRTAGMFYLFRPCGIRLGNYEMYTAESVSDIFKYLIDLFGATPHLLTGVGYDRVCDLHPFIRRLAANGHEIAKRYADLLYLVDIFHVEKHVRPKCVLGDKECEYHPHLSKFDHIKGINTEVAEQSFKEINQYKCSTRKMTYAKRLLFLKFLDHSTNLKKIEKMNKS